MTPTSEHGGCLSVAMIQSIAGGAITTPEAERHLSACASCAERLGAAIDSDALTAELASLTPVPEPSELPEVPGCVVVREIHRGAQGVVYEAHHEATRRPVAVKVLMQGAVRSVRQRARFEREVELAGALRHPGIVTIHDSGVTTRGRPFVVMELVEGVTLDRFLAARPRPAREIVGLFTGIADAVEHAHQHAIIHRDLKPSNVLIDADGQPRVVDFGIARPVDAESIEVTRPGDFIGTLAYAAPEQVASDAGSVGVRTDVYALGGMLYEALTGARLVSARSVADAVRSITQDQPARPSGANPGCDADLDSIVLKALAKEPARRYATAGALRDDLRRWLGGLAVDARRHVRGYVVRRAIRRHRVPIALASITLIVVGALGASVIVQTLRKSRITAAKAGIGESLSAVMAATTVESSDRVVENIPALVDELARIVERRLAPFPIERAGFENDLGITYWNLNETDKSVKHLELALALRKGHGAPDADLAESHHNLARAYFKAHRYPEAEEHFRRGLELRRSVFGTDHELVAETLHNLAGTLRALDKLPEAESLFNESLRIRERVFGPGSEEVANTLNSLAFLQFTQGRNADAVATARRALEIVESVHGPENWRTARVMHALGVYLRDSGQLDEAETLLTEARRVKLLWRSADDLDVRNTDDALERLHDLQRARG